MEKKDIVLQLDGEAAEGVRTFFDDCRTPMDLSGFVDSYLVAFWEFLRRKGYLEELKKIHERAKDEKQFEREYRMIYLEALEDWNTNIKCGLKPIGLMDRLVDRS